MENDYLLDMNMETISPPSSPKDQSPNSFSHDLIGRLGIISQGTKTVINETQNTCSYILVSLSNSLDDTLTVDLSGSVAHHVLGI